MFRMLKLKPPHGWNAVSWELGIVVLGVLIALGAQQMAESADWRQELKETRRALDTELGRDLAAFDWRWSQRECTRVRLDELDRWSSSMSGPAPLKLKKPISPPIFVAIRSAVWNATSGEVAARMPVETRLDYAGMYEAMRLFDGYLHEDAAAWIELTSFEEDGKLTREETHDVRKAIRVLRSNEEVLGAFRQRLDERAAKLGIRPMKNISAGLEAQTAEATALFCKPLL